MMKQIHLFWLCTFFCNVTAMENSEPINIDKKYFYSKKNTPNVNKGRQKYFNTIIQTFYENINDIPLEQQSLYINYLFKAVLKKCLFKKSIKKIWLDFEDGIQISYTYKNSTPQILRNPACYLPIQEIEQYLLQLKEKNSEQKE